LNAKSLPWKVAPPASVMVAIASPKVKLVGLASKATTVPLPFCSSRRRVPSGVTSPPLESQWFGTCTRSMTGTIRPLWVTGLKS
jgi:hypothetical protein